MKKNSLAIFFSAAPLSLKWALIAFLLVNVGFRHTGTTNASSRFATLLAITEDGTFAIDNYRFLTGDWSGPVNGHYYSNKAPGPALIAVPLFSVWHAAARLLKIYPTDDLLKLERYKNSALRFLSFCLQVFPFFILCLVVCRYLQRQRVSNEGQLFFALALLFGTTPSLLLNSYWGHGMAALFCVSAVLAVLLTSFAWSGFFFGLALLCDYASAALLPGFLILWIGCTNRRGADIVRAFKWLLVGGSGPAVVWIWYHVICFGGPFTLPQKFQNPLYVDVAENSVMWGQMHTVPSIMQLIDILVGKERGLLQSQPWVLALIPALVTVQRENFRLPVRLFTLLFVSGLSILILLNSMFGAWHSGPMVGPRYLSVSLILAPLVVGMLYDNFPRYVQVILWVLLAVSICLFGLAMPQSILADANPWLELFIDMYKKGILRIILVLATTLIIFAPIFIHFRGAFVERRR